MKTHTERIELARKSLTGIAIGDAFGQSFFNLDNTEEVIFKRQMSETNWCFTDDTIMAIPLFESLEQFSEINQDFIAERFTENYNLEWNRGYGPSMHRRLRNPDSGKNWLELSKSAFQGEGSMGNGGAMRAALTGAYFYNDLDLAAKQAKLSCEITHYNKEAVAGTVAVVIAAALCTQIGLGKSIDKDEWLSTIIDYISDSEVVYRVKQIPEIKKDYRMETVVKILGNGLKMIAKDTVPFVLWNVYHNMENFEDCLWKTVSGLGDRDTTCAMSGGISIMSSEESLIPKNWAKSVENWQTSKFYNNDRKTK